MVHYKVCPICCSKITNINKNNLEISICNNSSCRVIIKNNKISRLNLDKFAEAQEKFNLVNENEQSNIYMLLNEKLSGPLLIKTTNKALCNDSCMYCIIQAESREKALEIFKRKFEYIRVTDEMVVNISIKELD